MLPACHADYAGYAAFAAIESEVITNGLDLLLANIVGLTWIQGESPPITPLMYWTVTYAAQSHVATFCLSAATHFSACKPNMSRCHAEMLILIMVLGLGVCDPNKQAIPTSSMACLMCKQSAAEVHPPQSYCNVPWWHARTQGIAVAPCRPCRKALAQFCPEVNRRSR